MTDKPAKMISNYKVISKIGEGGMGEVFLAEDPTLERRIAIKMLTDECCDDDERLGRFMREAKTASALNHPNIITIFEFGKHEDAHFIATEFIDGTELSELLSAGRIPLEKAIDIGVQVVSALSAAHKAGIVHRDIKPSNIMIRQDNLVKILDFGLAKLAPRGRGDAATKRLGENDDTLIARSPLPRVPVSRHTIPGMVLGTPKYMSPEQARGHEIDFQSDIFSFGVVLYEMLTGTPPFKGETVSDLLASVLAAEPESVRKLDAGLPGELESIVEKALKKEKRERYQSTDELLNDLNDFKQGQLVQDHLSRTNLSALSHGEFHGPDDASESSARESGSIAVVPFANMSIEERRDYFSEGLTEEVVVNLSKLKMLRVVPHGSTPESVFEGKSHQEMAKILGVRYLLEGSVRRNGDDLRISTQLVDTADQSYLWSETYRGTISDIFEIQEKVASEIVEALEVTLMPGEEEKLRKRFTDNTEAYQLYLQGRFFWNKRSIEGLHNAIRHFEKAIELDPKYALAWAGIADSYSLLAEFGIIPHKELYPKAEAAVTKALEIDDKLAEVHTSYASLLLFSKWDWVNAEKEFKIALELNPNYATAHHWYSFWFLGMNNLEQAKAYVTKAAELDPVSQAIVKDKGMVYYYDRQYDEAIRLAKTTLEMDPEYPAAHRLLSLCYLAKEMFEESIVENRRWGELTGNAPEADFCLAHIHASAGNSEKALALVESVEQKADKIDNIYRGLALVYTALGDFDRAFEMLEMSYELREIALLSVKSDPKFEPLHGDKRFTELAKKMGDSITIDH